MPLISAWGRLRWEVSMRSRLVWSTKCNLASKENRVVRKEKVMIGTYDLGHWLPSIPSDIGFFIHTREKVFPRLDPE